MDLFVVFQFKGECEASTHFKFQGVFDSRERAEAACRDATYCVLAATLNLELPHETVVVTAPDCYYPKFDVQPAVPGRDVKPLPSYQPPPGHRFGDTAPEFAAPRMAGVAWGDVEVGNGVRYAKCPECSAACVVEWCARCNIASAAYLVARGGA